MRFVVQYNAFMNWCAQQSNFLPKGKVILQEKEFFVGHSKKRKIILDRK